MQMFQRSIHRFKVFLHDGIALLAVSFLNCRFNLVYCLVFGQDVGNRKETCLHHGVDALPHTGGTRHFNRVDCIKLQFLGNDFFLNFNRQMIPNLVSLIRRIQQESCPRLGNAQNIHFVHKRKLVASHKISLADKISRLNRIVRKTQVRCGHGTGFA